MFEWNTFFNSAQQQEAINNIKKEEKKEYIKHYQNIIKNLIVKWGRPKCDTVINETTNKTNGIEYKWRSQHTCKKTTIFESSIL